MPTPLARVYIETTVISYLTARPAKNPIQEGRRQITVEWWTNRRPHFAPVISPVVIDEAQSGDRDAAAARMAVLVDLPCLEASSKALALAEQLICPGALPKKAADDAAHIALCAVHAVPYLLTWNFRHIANATIQHRLDYICATNGFRLPVICTPEEL